MMQQAAIALGIELVVLTEDAGSGAALAVRESLDGRPDDGAMIRKLAADTDVVTVDHEVLDLDLLRELENEGVLLRPTASTLATAADKLAQKSAFSEAGLPSVAHTELNDQTDLDTAFRRWGEIVLKMAKGGYDGRGVWVRPDPTAAQGVLRRSLEDGRRLFAERAVVADLEVAVIVARRPGGDLVCYDPVTTLQVDGMCRQVTAPAGLEYGLRQRAIELAGRVADATGAVGVMAVELFVEEDQLLINEIAPRPHNSGHHTIESAVTSQFENHLRAVLDLPLGKPGLRSPAVMVNLVGSEEKVDPRCRLADAMAVDPGAAIHLYGKEPRPERKIGHVTVCDDDRDRAAERAWAVVAALGGDLRR